MRNQKKEVSKYIQSKNITNEQWYNYFFQLYKGEDNNTTDTITQQQTNDEPLNIILKKVQQAIKKLKLRNGIYNELLKYGGEN